MDVPADSMGTLDLDEGMIELIKPELASGERLIWAARSSKRPAERRPGRRLPNAIWAVGLLLLCIIGLLVYKVLGPMPEDLTAFVIAASLVLGFIGIINCLRLLAGLAREQERRRHSSIRIYAITDRRAIFWVPGDQPDSLEIFTLPRGVIRADGIRRVQYSDGTGDLYLRGYHRLPGGFLGISDVRRVEDLVRTHLIDPATTPTE